MGRRGRHDRGVRVDEDDAVHEAQVRALMEARVEVWLNAKLAAKMRALSPTLSKAEQFAATVAHRKALKRASDLRVRARRQADAAFRAWWQPVIGGDPE